MNKGIQVILLWVGLWAGVGGTDMDKIMQIVMDTAQRDRPYAVLEGEDPKSMKSQLNRMHEEEVQCIYVHGVSKQSIEDCYGANFAEMEARFTQAYDMMREDFDRTYQVKLMALCDERNEPCRLLCDQFHLAVVKGLDPASFLKTGIEKVSDSGQILRAEFDALLDQLRQEYRVLQNARNMIAAYSLRTINKIRAYIKSTKLPVPKGVMSYDPTKFYVDVGMGYTVVSKSQSLEQSVYDEDIDSPDIDLNGDGVVDHGQPFFDELLNNANARKMVNYHLANSKVVAEDLDLSQMPNDILLQIRRILKDKNSLL